MSSWWGLPAPGPRNAQPARQAKAKALDYIARQETSVPELEVLRLVARLGKQNVLPLYIDIDSIGPELAAKVIDTLSQLSLRTTGRALELVPA